MSEDSNSPSLAELLARAMDVRLDDIETGVVAQIVAFDAARGTCDARPVNKRVTKDETGARVVKSDVVISGIPVQFPGGGEAEITFPVRVGDYCMLLVNSTSLDRWKTTGGEVEPRDPRRFDLQDCVALVGFRPPGVARRAIATDRIRMGYQEGVAVDVYPSEVRVGADAGAVGAVALAAAVEARLVALETAHHHFTDGSPGITSGPTVVAAAYLADFPADSPLIANPLHGQPGHVHDSPEPLYASAAGTAGAGCASVTLKAH